jgi:hypothetical protein
MEDQLFAPGGYLGGFILAGILLPIALSFVVDGTVLYLRGRGPLRLFAAALVVLAVLFLYSIAWRNAIYAGQAQQLSGMVGIILWFSIPAAALGFAVRMLALFLNPSSKAQDRDAIAKRKARHALRLQSRAQGVRHA